MVSVANEGRGFSFSVPGTPVPLERPRVTRTGAYLPERSRDYRERIRWAWAQASRPSLGGASVSLQALFFFAHPPSHFGRTGRLRKPWSCTFTPPRGDTDNLLKAVLDALEGCAFDNDSQVTDLQLVMRRWSSGDACTEIVIRPVKCV